MLGVGLGFRVLGLGFRVLGLGFRVPFLAICTILGCGCPKVPKHTVGSILSVVRITIRVWVKVSPI